MGDSGSAGANMECQHFSLDHEKFQHSPHNAWNTQSCKYEQQLITISRRAAGRCEKQPVRCSRFHINRIIAKTAAFHWQSLIRTSRLYTLNDDAFESMIRIVPAPASFGTSDFKAVTGLKNLVFLCTLMRLG